MYVHALLKGEAKRFFFDKVKKEKDWNVMVETFNERYHGHVRARGIWEDSQKLSFKDFSCKITDQLKAYQSMFLIRFKISSACRICLYI